MHWFYFHFKNNFDGNQYIVKKFQSIFNTLLCVIVGGDVCITTSGNISANGNLCFRVFNPLNACVAPHIETN